MPVMNPATNLIYNMDKNMVASKRGHRLEINPLSPKSDQNQISPCNINAL